MGLLFKGDKEQKKLLWLTWPLDEEEAEHLSERHPDFKENQTLILFLTLCMGNLHATVHQSLSAS